MRLAIFLLFWHLAADGQDARPKEASAIEGRVINASTGEPVERVSLLLERIGSTAASVDWVGSYAAFSDSTGKFEIGNIDAGKYRLRASRNGFSTMEYGARTSQRPGVVLDLDRPQNLKNIDFRLTPHGIIAGRVFDADGEPLAGAQVQLLRSQYVNGRKALSTAKNTFTNDIGEYRMPGLVPGAYYIYAESSESLPPSFVAKDQYVPAYYPGATDSAGAVPLVVSAGAEARADLMLRKAPAATVKGRVVVDLPGFHGPPSVRFTPAAGHNNSAAATFRAPPAKVNAAGEFEIRSLTPGTYWVTAEVSRGARGYAGSVKVDVAGTVVDNVVVTIGAGLTLTGRIRVEGEAALDTRRASVKLLPGGPASASGAHGGTYRIAADRTFRIEELDPDRYGVMIEGLPDGFFAKSVRAGESDCTYSGVDLTSGVPGPVVITVSPRAGSVSGSVQDPATGQPAIGATVVLVPKEKERVGLPAYYPQATADQHGRFAFKNVVPGEYRAFAWADVESTAWMDPEFINPLESKGIAVTVAEDARANVQVLLADADRTP